MRYLKPYTYFHKKPGKGWNNVLMVAICSMIPVVGQMVLFGYRRKVSDALELDPELQDYPDFDFNRFMEYLTPGIWPTIVQIIVTIAFAIPYYVLTFGTFAILVASGLQPLIAMAISSIWSLPLMFMYVVMWPMEFHAMKTQKFAPIEELKFTYRFLRLTGIETFVSVMVSNIIMLILLFVGMLLCYVGMFFTLAIYQMAVQHIQTQLYLQYLEEGGTPLEEEVKLTNAYEDNRTPPRIAHADIE